MLFTAMYTFNLLSPGGPTALPFHDPFRSQTRIALLFHKTCTTPSCKPCCKSSLDTFLLRNNIQYTTMTATQHVLTCASNRRRRLRIHPTSDVPVMQTAKPKANVRVQLEDPSSASENIHDCEQSESRNPSFDSDSRDEMPSIFRQAADIDRADDFFVLKRANPVYDSDDEDVDSSPSKKQRTKDTSVLDCEDRLSEDDANGFTLSFSFEG